MGMGMGIMEMGIMGMEMEKVNKKNSVLFYI
jgi:hypothetical protein